MSFLEAKLSFLADLLVTNLTSDILTFDFQQDEKVFLGIREFKSIHISILDATGNPVKSESNFGTKLQVQFSLEAEST